MAAGRGRTPAPASATLLVATEARLPDAKIQPKVPQRPVDEGLFDRRPVEHQEELFRP